MGNQADRLRDLIHEVAEGELGGIAIGPALAAIADLGDTQNRAINALFDAVADHGDAILALSNRIEGTVQHGKALAEVMATRADLDDLRLEVREATATPFDPPEAHTP